MKHPFQVIMFSISILAGVSAIVNSIWLPSSLRFPRLRSPAGRIAIGIVGALAITSGIYCIRDALQAP